MTYERINFVDQSVERPRTYEMTHNADGSITLTDSFGLVNELGTPINADTMNHIEDGIDSKQDQLIAGDNIILEDNVISAKSGAMPIGTIVPVNANNNYVPDGLLHCDGTTYSRSQFEDFCENYLDKSSSLLNTCTMEEYEAEVAATGQCAKFGVDGLNTVVTDLGNTKAKIDTNGVAFASLYPNGVILEFIYDGSNWTVDGKVVNLSDYYITQTGTATVGDSFTVRFGTADSFRVPLIKDTETVVTNNIDYDNGVEIGCPISTAPFTAPCDGVYMTTLTKSNTNGYIYVNGVHTPFYRGDATGGESWDNFFIPLSKGDVIYWGVTLTPKASHFYPYKVETREKLKSFVVVANGQTNQSQMNWSAWASSLQGKMNADHSNDTKPYIVEVSDKSILPSWYRVWSDGWCEQGGELESVVQNTDNEVYLLKSFINTSYSVFVQAIGTKRSNTEYTNGQSIPVRNLDSFTINIQDYSFGRMWEAKGYIR